MVNMVKLPFSWPTLPRRSPVTQQPPQPKRRTPSILGPHTTLVLCAAVFWQAFILALAIAVATSAGGSWHYWSAHVGAYVGGLERAGIIFYYPFAPLLMLAVSAVDLIRRKTITVRRVIFSAAFTTTFHFITFIMWAQCAYLGGGSICWTGGWTYNYQRGDPEMFRHVLPWLALGSALVYLAFTAYAIVVLRRRNIATPDEGTYERTLVQQPAKPSFESSEISFGTVGDQTLPSRTQSKAMSRQLSQAQRSERPPTYYSTGDESLLTVDEKDEKDRNFGYV